MIDILFISIICVCIIDLSGFVQEMERMLKKWLKIQKGDVRIPKPFSCSLCMTFWSGLIYLLMTGQFTLLMVAYLLVVSVLTPQIKDTIYLLKDTIDHIINLIYNKIK